MYVNYRSDRKSIHKPSLLDVSLTEAMRISPIFKDRSPVVSVRSSPTHLFLITFLALPSILFRRYISTNLSPYLQTRAKENPGISRDALVPPDHNIPT